MTQFNPHARVEIFEEQVTEGKQGDAINQVWDSWTDARLFSAVRVELTTNESSQVEFSVSDPELRFINQYSCISGVPWLVARVWLGFGVDLGAPVFKGLLASVEHRDGISTLRFYDMAFKMKIQQKTGYHKGLDIDVMRELVVRNKLKFVKPQGVKPLPLKSKKQEAQTDWELLLDLAGDAGLVIYTRGDTVFASPPARTGEPVLRLGRKDVRVLMGGDMRYRLPENLTGRARRVEVRGRGRGGKRMAGVSSENQRGREEIVLNQSIKGGQSEAARRANAKKELEREHAFTCTVSTFLQTNIRADVRQTVELIEWGSLFSGRYLVDSISHDFAPGRMESSYELYRDIGEM
jgi:phage protein D